MTISITENLLFLQELLYYLTEFERYFLDHFELQEKIEVCLSQFMESSHIEIPFVDTLSNLLHIHEHKITDSFLADLKDLLSEELETGQFGVLIKVGPFTYSQYQDAENLCREQKVSLIAFLSNAFDQETYTAWTLDQNFSLNNNGLII